MYGMALFCLFVHKSLLKLNLKTRVRVLYFWNPSQSLIAFRFVCKARFITTSVNFSQQIIECYKIFQNMRTRIYVIPHKEHIRGFFLNWARVSTKCTICKQITFPLFLKMKFIYLN